MTAPDLDALIERLLLPDLYGQSITFEGCGVEAISPETLEQAREDMQQAAAALVQMRDSEALARGKIAEQMIEIERLTKLETECWSNPEAWMKWCDVRVLERAEHAEAEVARLTTTSTHQINSSQRRC